MSKTLYISYGGHGVDVAIKRADDLDKLMIENIVSKKEVKVLDLGCGAGGQSVRMVEAGAKVTAIDVHDFSKEFESYKNERGISDDVLHYINGDITNLSELISGKTFTEVCMQRVLHYLTYVQAIELLKVLYEVTEDKLYISVTGIGSDVAVEYDGTEVPIGERFTVLSEEAAEKFSIHEPVCLYSQKEFIEILERTGWQVEKCWESAFGNLKAVCSH